MKSTAKALHFIFNNDHTVHASVSNTELPVMLIVHFFNTAKLKDVSNLCQTSIVINWNLTNK